MTDVIVVGGGLIGCATAIELARRGREVVLVEAEQPGVGATGASAGMLAPQYEAAAAGEGFQLALEARQRYGEFARLIEQLAGWPVGYRRDGMLVANRSAEEEQAARAALEWQLMQGGRGEIVSHSDAVKEHAGLSPDMHSWLWLPDEAQIDAQRLAVALGSAVHASGCRLLQGERVIEVVSSGNQVTGIRTADSDVVRAECVVIAAGAWSGGIAGIPHPIPVRPMRGQILRLQPEKISGWPLVATHDARYIVPRENGTILIGSTMEDVGFNDAVTERRFELAEHAASLIPALAAAPVIESWAGLRPITPDRWPVVGPDPDLEGLFLNTGHGRNGILLGPLTASIVADLITKGESELSWRVLRPDRWE